MSENTELHVTILLSGADPMHVTVPNGTTLNALMERFATTGSAELQLVVNGQHVPSEAVPSTEVKDGDVVSAEAESSNA